MRAAYLFSRPCVFKDLSIAAEVFPQRLKPEEKEHQSARLKPCPPVGLLFAKVLLITICVFCGWPLRAQEGPLVTDPPKGMTPEQVIQKFTAKEKEFKNARKACTYRQSVRFQTMDGTQSTSEYRQIADIKFDGNGNKVKTIVLSPQASMKLSPEDEMDIESRLHWTLSTDELPEYKVTYKGQQQEDDLHTYVFDVEPKEIREKQRYFQGTIWVDDHDFQIVKMTGKSVPDILPKKKKQQPNLFPKFTTWRELIDGKYWFPTYSLTDDTLHFPTADVHLVGTVKATDIKCTGW